MNTTRLWTIQPAILLHQIEASGFAHARKRYASPEAYEWLSGKLQKRLPGYPGRHPWWFYCRRPDLRLHRYQWPLGEEHVCLEVELDSSRFLSFPSWAWDDVFSGQYLALSLAEHERWTGALRRAVPDDETWPLPEPWKGRLERSWERLFDRAPARPWAGHRRISAWNPRGREAVASVILESDIRRVTRFRGASRDEVLLRFHRHRQALKVSFAFSGCSTPLARLAARQGPRQ